MSLCSKQEKICKWVKKIFIFDNIFRLLSLNSLKFIFYNLRLNIVSHFACLNWIKFRYLYLKKDFFALHMGFDDE